MKLPSKEMKKMVLIKILIIWLITSIYFIIYLKRVDGKNIEISRITKGKLAMKLWNKINRVWRITWSYVKMVLDKVGYVCFATIAITLAFILYSSDRIVDKLIATETSRLFVQWVKRLANDIKRGKELYIWIAFIVVIAMLLLNKLL